MTKTDLLGRFSVGVDIIEIERIEVVLRRHGERFLQRVYTPKEQAYCRGRVPELAVRFAAKEAVSKALGTGLRGIAWKEMEILGDERGKPLVHLHGRARARAEELGLFEFAVSLSHSREYAVAFVMATGISGNQGSGNQGIGMRPRYLIP
jgi:holo-[acyl-carrier protein] synthase